MTHERRRCLCDGVVTLLSRPGQSTYDTKGKTAIDSAYRYDPRFDRWLQIASLNEKRTFFHLSALKGKLFAVGGRNASGEIGELVSTFAGWDIIDETKVVTCHVSLSRTQTQSNATT